MVVDVLIDDRADEGAEMIKEATVEMDNRFWWLDEEERLIWAIL